jgi:hypothetical protein
VIDSVNLKIKLAQYFRCTYRSRICVYIYRNKYSYIYIYIKIYYVHNKNKWRGTKQPDGECLQGQRARAAPRVEDGEVGRTVTAAASP